MATETLGAHLRNLLTPYKTLLNLVNDVIEGKMDIKLLEKYKCNNLLLCIFMRNPPSAVKAAAVPYSSQAAI